MAGIQRKSLELTHVPITKTGMLIRGPVTDVFEALVNPDITMKFWFTKGSGRLEIETDSMGLGNVRRLDPSDREGHRDDGYSGPTTVEWKFASQNDGTTFVSVTESGYTGNGDELVKYVADSTQGFTLTLAGLKAFLEHGVRLNLTAAVPTKKVVPTAAVDVAADPEYASRS